MSWWQWYRLPTQNVGEEDEDILTWLYRRPITVNNTSGGVLSDFQILVELTPANFTYSHSEAGGADIRFLRDDGETALDYWIEEWVEDGTSKLWVEVDSIPTGNTLCTYMYYGKPGASDAGDGDATFLFFDGFEGATIDTDKWEGDTGNASVANSIVTFSGTTMGSKTLFPKPFIMELKGYWGNVVTGGGWIGARSSWQEGFYVYSLTDNKYYCRTKGPTGAFIKTQIYDAITSWYRHVVKWKTLEVKHYINGNWRATHTHPQVVPSADLGGHFYVYDTSIYCDWIFFRQYTSVEPSYVVGAEEVM